jgi:hypothetical protein
MSRGSKKSSVRPAKARRGVRLRPKSAKQKQDVVLELKKNLRDTRLPPKLKKQILAEMPTWDEQKLLYRELQQKGGSSSQQFLRSLGIEENSQS